MQIKNDSIIVDANIILRWILNDIPEQYSYSHSLIASGKAFLLPEVLAEVVFVMKSVYKIEKNKISTVLKSILPAFQCEDSNLLLTALTIFEERSLDFVDCILASYKKLYDFNIESFDKKLKKYMKTFDNTDDK